MLLGGLAASSSLGVRSAERKGSSEWNEASRKDIQRKPTMFSREPYSQLDPTKHDACKKILSTPVPKSWVGTDLMFPSLGLGESDQSSPKERFLQPEKG